ncbi:collagen-like triple helix repeat-containing protein [Geomonas edaphica]|uniref:collagen-like triple helix repeat-containing protein n=1 Tax=Geomonas edaphica TaxID=2570226 RepID=UPI0018E07B8C|nr:collagen-like protein [Geomonas edaphica]
MAGTTGPQGPAGTNGANGATGPQGPQGPAGSPDTQADILTKLRAQTDGAVLTMQQGATEDANTAKLKVVDASGADKLVVTGDGKLGIGTATPSTPLHVSGKATIYQSGKASSSQGLLIAGDGILAASPKFDDGVVFQLGYNSPGNRQLWLADSTQTNSATNYAFRYILGFQLPQISAMATDGSVSANLNMQSTPYAKVGIGFASSAAQSAVLAKLHVNNGDAAVPAQIVQGAISQTANLTEWRSSNGVVKAAINANGGIIFPDGSTQTTAAVNGGGTVTGVTSANSDIFVTNTSTTPTLTLNSGTGANQIVKLTSTGKLPAVDGSLLTGITAGATPAGTITGVIQGRNAAGNGFIADDAVVVDSTNHRLGVGTTVPTSPLHVVGKTTVYQANKVAASQGLLLAGDGIAAASPASADGAVFQLGYNGTGNRQLWLLDSAQMGSASNYAFRYILGFQLPIIGGVTADGSNAANITLQTNNSAKVGIGFPAASAQTAVQAKLHVINSEAAAPAQIVQGATTQTANLTEWRDSTAAVKAAVTSSGQATFSGGSANKAICWKSDGKTLGYCTTAIDATGGCTCN